MRFRAPQLYIRHFQYTGFAANHQFLVLINFNSGIAFPGGLHIHLDACGVDIHGFQMYLGDMILLPDDQMYRPVDAGAGIPTAVGFQRIVHC